MSDIPADIMDAAEEALDNLLCNCSESCGGDAGLRKASIEEIGKAILAERESHADLLAALVWAMGKIAPPNSVCTDEAHERFNFAMSAISKAEGGAA